LLYNLKSIINDQAGRNHPINKSCEVQMQNRNDIASKAEAFLQTLCSVKPNRRTGSVGNRQATAFFADTLRAFSYEIYDTPFTCLDYASSGALLTHSDLSFEVFVSPYSLSCDATTELVVASTPEELEKADCEGKLRLLRGPIASEQLMPKNFVFYNPDHHKKIIALLESQKPAGIIAATARQPELVGALYPFPLFLDGDFDIPSVYCKDTVGDVIARLEGEEVHLRIDAQRIPSSANNVIARLNQKADQKILITAHIDAYEDSPGALDNAAGTVVLLLLTEMLSDYQGNMGVEIAAFNGEDHYSAGGEMDYLDRYGDFVPNIALVVNLDDLGYKEGKSAYSFYTCPQPLEKKVGNVFKQFDGLIRGDPWFQGDHMIFVQKEIPALAISSKNMAELMRTVAHTSSDTPDLVDCHKLVEVAAALNALVRSF